MSSIGSNIDFLGDPIFESATRFFVIILKFIFTPIFAIKIHEKKFLDTKIISFSKVNGTHKSLRTAKAISNPNSVGVKLHLFYKISVKSVIQSL